MPLCREISSVHDALFASPTRLESGDNFGPTLHLTGLASRNIIRLRPVDITGAFTWELLTNRAKNPGRVIS